MWKLTRPGRWCALTILTMTVAGCATAPSERWTCPPLVAYPAALGARAANDLDTLPATSPVHTLIGDYRRLRDACRALTKKD